VVGGLALSQFLTLYLTPVVYIWLDKLSEKFAFSRIKESDALAAGLTDSGR
jgi:HAE1 family hydrophobic/amphiphilic exporter-1